MNALAEILNQAWLAGAQRLGWVLVHFVWQGALIAGLLWLALRLLSKRGPQARYLAACLALLLTVATPVVTFCVVQPTAQDSRKPGEASHVTYPEDDSLGKGMPLKVLSEFVDGTATIEQATSASPFGEASAGSYSPSDADAQPVETDSGRRAQATTPQHWLQRMAGRLEPAMPYAVAIWLAGVIACSVWHVGGWLKVQRLRRGGQPLVALGDDTPATADWLDAAERLAAALSLRRPVRMLKLAGTASGLAGPVVFGVLRPAVLIPAAVLTGLTPPHVEAILAHELAHIRRHDYLVNLLQTVVETLLFYHPAVWWVSARIRAEREHCCDDVAVAAISSMGILPMGSTGVSPVCGPGVTPASAPDAATPVAIASQGHRQDARGTHGQDAHATQDTCRARRERSQLACHDRSRMAYAEALAALAEIAAANRPAARASVVRLAPGAGMSLLSRIRRLLGVQPNPTSRWTAALAGLLVLTALVAGIAFYGCTADSTPQAPESQPSSATQPAPSASSGQATQPASSGLAKPARAEVERRAAESEKRTTEPLPSELFWRRLNPPWTAEEKARLLAMLEAEYLPAAREEKFFISGRNVPHISEEEARKRTRYLARGRAEMHATPLIGMYFGGPNTWGESANGLQARLYVKSTSQQPRASAVLVFHLRNTSDKPIRILKLSARARSWGEHLPLEIRRSGAVLKYQGPVLTPPSPPNESEYITLNPGDVDSTEVTFVPEHWKLAVPFEAQAVFVFKQTLRENKTVGPYDHDKRQWRTVSGLWTGEARAQDVTVKMGTVAQTAGTKPARVASAKAAARAAGLKKSGNSYFELRPVSVAGMKRLVLYPTDAKGSFPATTEVAYLSPEQHRAIIDHLAVEGFLDNAASYGMANPQYKGPTIVLRAHWGKGFYDENLGWNPKMRDRLDGLRKLLNGDAGKAMDKYLAQLQAQQEKRKPAASTRSGQAASPATSAPATQPVTRRRAGLLVDEITAVLDLTSEQQAKVQKWVEAELLSTQVGAPNPAKLARFLGSILEGRQKVILRQLIISGKSPAQFAADRAAANRPTAYHLYWLTKTSPTEYVDLLISKRPIQQLPAVKFDTTRVLLEAPAVVITTYARDSIWDAAFRRVESVKGVDLDKQEIVLNGQEYHYSPAPLQDVIALLKNPEGTIQISRIVGPLERDEGLAKELLTRLKSQLAEPFLTLVRQAIDMKPESTGLSGGQRPTGLDFSPILASTGQDGDLKAFPEDRGKQQGAIKALENAKKAWALAALLNHDSVDVKIRAAQALERLAEPQTAPVLLAAAKANNYPVMGSEGATIHAMYRSVLKSSLEKITGLKLMPNKDLKLDFAKVEAYLAAKYPSAAASSASSGPATQPDIRNDGVPAAVAQQIARLASRDPDERGQACMALADMGQTGQDCAAAVPSLVRLLGDKAKWRTWTYQPERVRGLHIEVPVGETAGYALWRGGPCADEARIAVMNDADAFVRENAISRLEANNRTIPTLIEALRDSSPPVRRAAAAHLWWAREPRVFEALLGALKDKDESVRGNAVQGLGRMGDKRAVVPLIEALRDESEAVQASAAWSLMKFKDPRAAAELKRTLMEAKWSGTRRASAEALGELGDNGALEALERALKDPDEYVRKSAAGAIQKIRRPAMKSRPAGATAPAAATGTSTQAASATQPADRAKLLVKQIQDQAEREFIDALVRAIKRDLPADWSVAQVRHGEVKPTHRPADQGWEIHTLRSGYKPADMKRGISVEGRLWIMDRDYVGQSNVPARAASTSPARELPSWHGRRVFESGKTYAAKALQETRTVDDVRKQWAALMARYKSKDERYWNDSIRKLDRWTDDRVIPEMVADFRNKNVDAHVRRSTLRILARMDDRKTIPIMVEAAKDSDAQIRSYAVACLGRKGGPEAFGVIEAALKDANENVRHSAMVAMGALRDNRSLDVLLKLLEDPNDLTRGYAAEGLGELGDQRAKPRLAAAMKDKSELVRRFAILALARLGDPIVLDRLLTALKTDVDGLHAWAPRALGQLGDQRAVEPLIVAMKDQDINMRSAAIRALGKLNDRRAVEPLLAALKDADSTIRRYAAESLGELGEPRAVEALKPLLSDNVDSVRAAASNALKKPRQAAPKPATQPVTAKAEPQWLSRIREALPKGWSLKRDGRGPGEHWMASRNKPIRVICHSPIAMGPDERTLHMTIIVGPKVSPAEYRRMVEFNAALEQKYKGNLGTLRLNKPWPWWDKRTETSKNRPYLLPTHYDDANSLSIYCKPVLIGSYEFKSKEDASETANFRAAIESQFKPHKAAAPPATRGQSDISPTPATATPLCITPKWILWQTQELIPETARHRAQGFVIRFFLQRRGDQRARPVWQTREMSVHWKATVLDDGTLLLHARNYLIWVSPDGKHRSQRAELDGKLMAILTLWPDGVVMRTFSDEPILAWFVPIKDGVLASDRRILLTGEKGFRFAKAPTYYKIARHGDEFAWFDDAGAHVVNVATGARRERASAGHAVQAFDGRTAVGSNMSLNLDSGKSNRLEEHFTFLAVHNNIAYAVKEVEQEIGAYGHPNNLQLLAIDMDSGKKRVLAKWANAEICYGASSGPMGQGFEDLVKWDRSPVLFAEEPEGLTLWDGTDWRQFMWLTNSDQPATARAPNGASTQPATQPAAIHDLPGALEDENGSVRASVATLVTEAEALRKDQPEQWAQWDEAVADVLAKRAAMVKDWVRHDRPPPADVAPLKLPLAYLDWHWREASTARRMPWVSELGVMCLRAIADSGDERRIDILLQILGEGEWGGKLLVKAMTAERVEASIRELLAGAPKLTGDGFDGRDAPLHLLLREFAAALSPEVRKVGYDWLRSNWPQGPSNGEGAQYWETLFRLDLDRARREVIPYYGQRYGSGRYDGEVLLALLAHAGPSEEVANAVRQWRKTPDEWLDPFRRRVLVCADPGAELEGYVAYIEAQFKSGQGPGGNIPYLVRTLVEHIPRQSVKYLRQFANDRRLTGLTGEGARLRIVGWLVEQKDEQAEKIVARWLAEEDQYTQGRLINILARQGEFARGLLRKIRPDIKLPPLPTEKTPAVRQDSPQATQPASRPFVTAGKPFDQRPAVTLAQASADVKRDDCLLWTKEGPAGDLKLAWSDKVSSWGEAEPPTTLITSRKAHDIVEVLRFYGIEALLSLLS